MDIHQQRVTALRAIIGELQLKDFADRHDLDASYLSQILNGHRSMGERAAIKMERKVGLQPGTLSAPTSARPQPYIEKPPAEQLEVEGARMLEERRLLPVIGNVQAGAFCEAVDLYPPGYAEEWVEAGGPAGRRAFVLIVDGMSMYPLLSPGDKVVIDPDMQWAPGSIVLAKRLQDQGVTIKKLCKDGSEYYLHATNPDWPEKYIKLNEEWMICGRARRKIVDL